METHPSIPPSILPPLLHSGSLEPIPAALAPRQGHAVEKPAVHSREHAERLTTIHTRVHAANFQVINQPDGSTTVGIEPTTLLAVEATTLHCCCNDRETHSLAKHARTEDDYDPKLHVTT